MPLPWIARAGALSLIGVTEVPGSDLASPTSLPMAVSPEPPLPLCGLAQRGFSRLVLRD